VIIDIHRHMWSAKERYRAANVPVSQQPAGTNFDWEDTTRGIVAEMDAAGVDLSVLVVADFADRRGEPFFSVEEENHFMVEARNKYPDRLFAFYGIDPRRPGAAAGFERAITEWKVQGLKLHPSVGFFAHDRVCYPFYEACVLHDLPVLFHVGTVQQPRLYSRFCHPLEFDQVAADFPELIMIMGHAGADWWADCVAVAIGHPNMVLDFSGWPLRLRTRPQEALYAIDRMRNVLGIQRLLWGNDFPGPRERISLKECKEVFQRLPSLGAKHGYSFSDADVQAILGANAQSLLKLH